MRISINSVSLGQKVIKAALPPDKMSVYLGVTRQRFPSFKLEITQYYIQNGLRRASVASFIFYTSKELFVP